MKTNWNTTLIALAVSSGLFSVGANAITGTASVQGEFKTTIEAGTCTAQIQNASGQSIDTLAFGDVYKSDLVAQSRSEPFKIAFSDCAGVKSATFEATPGSGGSCTGNATDGDSFSAGNATGFEVWKGDASSGTLLSCNTKPSQKVTLSGKNASVDMTARIVLAKDSTIDLVSAGDVSAPVTFVVTYQ